MKKQMIALIAAVCVLILGCGSLYWALHLEPQSQEPEEQPPIAEVQLPPPLTDQETGTLRAVTCTNANGGFTLVQEAGVPQLSDPAAQGLPADQMALNAIVRAAVHLQPLCVAADAPENPAAFGLEPAQARAELAFTDGTKLVLHVGRTAPDDSGLYCMQEGGQKVFILPQAQTGWALQGVNELLSREIPAPDPAQLYERITLGGSSREREIVLVPTDKHVYSMSAYEIAEPRARIVNDVHGEALMQSLCEMTADRIVCTHPNQQDLHTYGLDRPYSVVSFQGTTAIRFLSSEPRDGMVYVCREDVPAVYAVPADGLIWLDQQLEDLALQLVVMPHVTQIGEIRISGGETDYRIRLDHREEGLQVTVNEQPVSTDLFKKLYQVLIGLPATISFDEPVDEAQALLEIDYVFRDGHDPIQICLMELDGRSAQVWKNGAMDSVTKAAYRTKILEDCARLLSGQDIISSY